MNRVWLAFGRLLHRVVSPLIMGAIFFLCVTPTGWIMRLLGKDVLSLKRQPERSSYWIVREPAPPAAGIDEEPVLGSISCRSLRELWAFMRVRKKYWLVPDADHAGHLRRPDHPRAGIGGGAVHLHVVLTGAHPRHIGVLSRQRGGAAGRRPARGRRAGGALHAQEAGRALSRTCDRLLPRRGRTDARRHRLRRLLRKAVPEIRAAAGDLCRLCAARLQILRDGDPDLDAREAVPEGSHPPRIAEIRARLRLGEPAPLHRAPSEPRRQRLLCVALPGGGGADARWRRRMVHHLGGGRSRQGADDPQGAAFPAFARAAVFRLHLLHRLQGQFRRVQADGACALRPAEICVADSRSPDRSQGGRDVPARPRLFQLLHRPDDDQSEIRRPVRRAGARLEEGLAHPVPHGRRGLDPGGHRGGDAAARPLARARAWPRQSVPRRRRRAQLRCQRQDPARRRVQEHLGAAGRGRRRRRGRRCARGVAPVSRQGAQCRRRARHHGRRLPRPGLSRRPTWNRALPKPAPATQWCPTRT